MKPQHCMIKNRPWFCQDCRVLMEKDSDGVGYFVCPLCGIEVWPPDMPIETVAEEAAGIAEEEAGKNDDFFVHPKKAGGGGRSTKGSNNKKQLLKKKTPKKLYEELCR